MTIVSNDPSWWPYTDALFFCAYWTISAGVIVVYDWVTTIGQEIELIWRQRWSLMTALYLGMRYIGILYSIANVLASTPFVSVTDAVSNIVLHGTNAANVVLTAMLGVVMIARLHAMYQGSRTLLIFLVIIFLGINIAGGALVAITLTHLAGEEAILFGILNCAYGYDENIHPLIAMVWVLNTVWEVLALCLSVWVAVRQFRDLQRFGLSTGSTAGDCFKVLIQSHVLYFVSFVGVSFSSLGLVTPLESSYFIESVLFGSLQVLSALQMFVLGPRLILSVRECHAKLVAYSDADTSMNSIVFQEFVHVSTSSTV
ncbi:hypothetical protein CY34DRAFT_415130 [Suillus luteus UH-Slu-Lm8-n1]|uniref:Unplaced genomic scaffold CY34scaffold_284, whole genome shotgun sequence n=1 Tax=Suillus luteus UH-Slu-Lm8-n1 TaxID=930992 RepID=A0A0D0A8M2_9AGAM|nr:hypothetical protein CY34DRAFT_415130 [Suillus luteus UH-Slu-Lm8-n1]